MTMRKYTALAALSLQAGAMVELTARQAVDRLHALEPVRVSTDPKTKHAGLYRVVRAVGFKAGEEITTDVELNKQLATTLEPVEQTTAKKKAKAQADADAKNQALMAEKAQKWDEVQEELAALRTFVEEIKGLPKDLLDQVQADVDKRRAAIAEASNKGKK